MPAVLPQARGLLQGRRRVPRRARVRSDRQAPGRRMARREAAPALADPRRLRSPPRSRPACRARDDFNRGDNEGVGYFDVNQRARHPLERDQGLPASRRCRARTCRSGPARTSTASSSTAPRDRRRGRAARRRRAGRLRSSRRAAKSSSRPARSARRRSCSSRASARPRCSRRTASPSRMPCPASARTCRTTCRSAPSTASKARRRSTRWRRPLWGKALIGLQYAWKRSGPMSMAPSQLGAFTRSSPERAHPNLEYHVQPLSLDAFGEPLHRIQRLHRERLQPQPDQPRPRSHPLGRSGRARRASRPTTCRPTTTATSPPRACA